MCIQRCRHQSDVEDTVATTTFSVEASVCNCSLSLASPEDLIGLVCALHLHLCDIIDKHHILGVTLQILGGRDPTGDRRHITTYIYMRVHGDTYICILCIHTYIRTYVCILVSVTCRVKCITHTVIVRTCVYEWCADMCIQRHTPHLDLVS